MKINKYLKELGYNWYDLPGNYDENLKNNVAAADIRNKENEDGFCSREFWNLDNTFDLFIYSRMCYFRDNIAEMTTPSCFFYNKNGEKIDGDIANNNWTSIINEITEGFKLSLTTKTYGDKEVNNKIDKARRLFIEYYDCFWY